MTEFSSADFWKDYHEARALLLRNLSPKARTERVVAMMHPDTARKVFTPGEIAFLKKKGAYREVEHEGMGMTVEVWG